MCTHKGVDPVHRHPGIARLGHQTAAHCADYEFPSRSEPETPWKNRVPEKRSDWRSRIKVETLSRSFRAMELRVLIVHQIGQIRGLGISPEKGYYYFYSQQTDFLS
jgi:hypothetical protein